jgi:acyl carrier protein phosphodiesterase
MDNAPLPHWLAPTAHQAIQPVEHHIDNPVDPSLVPPLIPTALLDPQERRRLSKELLDATFDAMLERVLTEITRGRTLKSIVAEDLRNIDYEAFWRWIKRDPRRMERYKEAKELRTEWWAGRIVEIAEADDALEDVARSKLKIDTYKWLMGADNRKTYGESKQIEVSTSISITAALEQARSRVAALPVVEEISDVDDPLALPSPDSNAD